MRGNRCAFGDPATGDRDQRRVWLGARNCQQVAYQLDVFSATEGLVPLATEADPVRDAPADRLMGEQGEHALLVPRHRGTQQQGVPGQLPGRPLAVALVRYLPPKICSEVSPR